MTSKCVLCNFSRWEYTVTLGNAKFDICDEWSELKDTTGSDHEFGYEMFLSMGYGRK
jgi:hypothetical protein